MAARKRIPSPDTYDKPQGVTHTEGRNATRSVTVACKLPNGLFLQLFEPGKDREVGPGGQVRIVDVAVRQPRMFHVHGNAFPRNGGGRMAQYDITSDNGYALTPGIPRDFWEKWLEQNKDADYVRNGFIFAFERKEDVIARAHETEKKKTGFEPLDPDNLPKTGFKLQNGARLTNVETANDD